MNNALSREDWEKKSNDFIRIGATGPEFQYPTDSEDGWPPSWTWAPDPHGSAALLLHGQPFGFAWEDVEVIKSEVDILSMVTLPLVVSRGDPHHAERVEGKIKALQEIAQRIAALLPPREAT